LRYRAIPLHNISHSDDAKEEIQSNRIKDDLLHHARSGGQEGHPSWIYTDEAAAKPPSSATPNSHISAAMDPRSQIREGQPAAAQIWPARRATHRWAEEALPY
jgi:hypothetical protein